MKHKRCPNKNTSNNSKSTLPSICSVPLFRCFDSAQLALILKGSAHSAQRSQEPSIVFNLIRSWKVSNFRIIFNWVETTTYRAFVYNLFQPYFFILKHSWNTFYFLLHFWGCALRPKITGLRFPWNHRCSMSYWLTFFSLYGFITEVRFGVVMVILELRGVGVFFNVEEIW